MGNRAIYHEAKTAYAEATDAIGKARAAYEEKTYA